jgi:tetratricopeptide (TPR) repeat protein
LDVQEEIARGVTDKLQLTLFGREAKPTATTTNKEAYDAYLWGRHFSELGSPEDIEKAAEYFEKAIRLDPGYARAWVSLSDIWAQRAGGGYVSVEEGYQKARDAIQRALALDGDLGDAHGALGEIRMFYDWDWVGADESFHRALALKPGDAGVMSVGGSLARFLGHLDEALALYRRAIAADPLNSNCYKNEGIILYDAGRLEEAKADFNKALELSPGRAYSHSFLSQVWLAESRPQQALNEAELENHPTYRLLGLALAYHAQGKKKESDGSVIRTDFEALEGFALSNR